MKRQIILFVFLVFNFSAFAQVDSIQPPFKKFPVLPPLKLLLTDSTTYFTKENFAKKTPVLIILFNPDCEHCKAETKELLDNMEHFKNIQIIMATMMSFEMMKNFYAKFKLADYTNITVGKDITYFLPVFYHISNLPYLALYNKKGELITTFEGAVPLHKVLQEFDK